MRSKMLKIHRMDLRGPRMQQRGYYPNYQMALGDSNVVTGPVRGILATVLQYNCSILQKPKTLTSDQRPSFPKAKNRRSLKNGKYFPIVPVDMIIQYQINLRWFNDWIGRLLLE